MTTSTTSTIRVRYHSVAFEVDLDAIREALARRELTDGVTLAQVADRAGVSRMSLWRLLDGQRVSLRTLHRVLTVLELDPSQVLRTAA
jgi:transcriptional regulator with XRE-family HTH domain